MAPVTPTTRHDPSLAAPAAAGASGLWAFLGRIAAAAKRWPPPRGALAALNSGGLGRWCWRSLGHPGTVRLGYGVVSPVE